MNNPPISPTPSSTPAPVTYGTPGYPGTPYGGDVTGPDNGFPGNLDLFRILRILRKKWLTVALALLFAGAGAAYYAFTTDKIYRATSLVELSVRRPRIMTQQAAVIEDQSNGSQSEEIFNTRLEKFKGRAMREATIARYRKQHPQRTLRDEAFMELLSRNLTLTLLRRTRLVRIEFNHTDPHFAAYVCTAFAEAAEASVYDENRIASDAAVLWLEAQCATQRSEVEKADTALLRYRQENKIDVLESQRKTVDDALMDFNRVLVDLESQEAKERDLLAAMAAIELKPENAGSLPASIPRGDEIKSAMDKWMAALAERDALLSKYTPRHPDVVAKDGMVTLFRNQAFDALTRAKATSASNLDLLRHQAESLRAKKAEQAKLASDLELQIVERRTHLTALERTRDACDAAYRGILGRIQEARMAADENTATVKIVERASVPEQPVKPRPFRILALALLLGLVGGLGLAILQDSLGDRLVSPHEIEMAGMAKVLAVIPHSNTRDRHGIATASATLQHSEISEAFAGLRAMLDSPQYKVPHNVILLSSSVPSEGKTVTACNLAITYARHGERTLLIDFDLRRPRLAGVFALPAGHPSLADFLAGGSPEADFHKLPYAAPVAPGLSVIAGHAAPHSHPELVNENKLAALLHWARTQYDRIILDAPPLGLVSDALALAALSNTVLVVARPEVSRKRAVWHTLHRLREAGVAVLAVVVNDVDFSKGMYGYGPNYHSYAHYKTYDGRPETATSSGA
jgi:capsular exopolysaccharide synthesis family protein